MKYTKLLSLAFATLFFGSAMAAPTYNLPTETLVLPKISEKGWTDKVTTPYIVSGDTIVLCAYATAQSTSSQLWINSNNKGSSSASWNAEAPFRGAAAYGATSYASTKTEADRVYSYRVSNCTEVLAYVASGSDKKRTVYIEAYEMITDTTAATTYFAQASTESKTPGTIKLTGLKAEKEYVVVVYSNGTGSKGSSNGNSNFYEIAFVAAPLAKNICTLDSLYINGEPLEGFKPDSTNYEVELPYGTKTYPTVTAVCTSPRARYFAAAAQKTGIFDFPATQVVICTAEDNTTTQTYNLRYTVKAEANHDASISSLTLKGLTISNPKPDTLYTLTYDYLTSLPSKSDLSVVFNDEFASIVAIDSCIAWGHNYEFATVAQDGTTRNVYRLRLLCKDAPKLLYEVLFSNGAKGAINDEDTVITVPYLSTEEVPNLNIEDIQTDSLLVAGAYRKCTAALNENGNIVVTGEDNTTITYPINGYELTAPTALGTDTVKFDGSEISYIYGAYGFDASKGWKFAKKVNDASNRRISKGTTRLYIAMPAADSLTLISGSGSERAIKVYVNGVQDSTITTTAATGKSIKFRLDATKANFIAIESNQTKGDGGFTGLILTPAKQAPTAIDNTTAETKVTKVFRNGQLYIIKDNKTYNALGTVIE